MIKRAALSALVLLVIGAAVLGIDVYRHMHAPAGIENETTFTLEPGASVRHVARSLHNRQILERPLYLRFYARVTGMDGRLKAGEYRLEAGQTPVRILRMMVEGDVRQYALTIVEGWTFRQVRRAIAEQATLAQTLDAALSDAEVMAELGYPQQHPEGRFYPDTYYFPRGTADTEFLRRAYEKMDRVLSRQWEQRSEGLPLQSAYEALILASIIEKESAVPDERPLIAAVFINRLEKGMRLQTDPTVIYGMGEAFDGDIRYRDLRRDTPYNTYTRGGLPPTPIAMPSEAAIHAALHPADSDALYFVSKGDGSHQFSTTLAEHNAAVDRYQRR